MFLILCGALESPFTPAATIIISSQISSKSVALTQIWSPLMYLQRSAGHFNFDFMVTAQTPWTHDLIPDMIPYSTFSASQLMTNSLSISFGLKIYRCLNIASFFLYNMQQVHKFYILTLSCSFIWFSTFLLSYLPWLRLSKLRQNYSDILYTSLLILVSSCCNNNWDKISDDS